LQLRLSLRYFSLARGFPSATDHKILNMKSQGRISCKSAPVSTLGP
jgi:hypothetical protein